MENGSSQEPMWVKELEGLRDAPLEVIMAHPVAKVIYDIGFKMGESAKTFQDLDAVLADESFKEQKTPETIDENGEEEPLDVEKPDTEDMEEEKPIDVGSVEAEEKEMKNDVSDVEDKDEDKEAIPDDSFMESGDPEEPVMNGETPSEDN